MRRWKAVLSLVVVFLAGMIVGGVLMLGGIHRWHQNRINAETWTPRTMTWLRREVQLAPEQESKVEPIVVRAMQDLSELRDRADGERKAIFSRLFLELSEHLTAEQQQKMKESIARATAAKRI
jgi:hypothetical protein